MPLADVAELQPDAFTEMLGQPFFNSLQIANVCALNAKNPQIIKEGFSGNQDALRLPSK
jgi:hypothetical protein